MPRTTLSAMTLPAAYRPLRAFAEAARPNDAPLRTFTGFFMVGMGYYLLFPLVLGPFVYGDEFEMSDPMPLDGLLLLLAPLVGLLLLRLILYRLHGRGLRSAMGNPLSAANIAVPIGAFALLISLVAMLLPPWVVPFEVAPIVPWFITVVIGLPLLLVQVSFEEILFRGYLQQQIAARTENPLLWMVFPSVIFGGAHFFNAETTYYGIAYSIWATMLGLAFADLTARHGTLGPAIALHFAINFSRMFVVGSDDTPFAALALLRVSVMSDGAPFEADVFLQPEGIGVIFGLVLVCAIQIAPLWLLARYIIRR